MDGAGNLSVVEREFTVSGKGETQAAALDSAFAALRKTVISEIKQPIVYMEPLGVEVLDISVAKWTEKYLMLFWPRERRTYDLTVKVKVMVKLVDLSQLECREVAPSSRS